MPSNNYFTGPDGLRLFFRDYEPQQPSGKQEPPILCIHGLTRNGRDFGELAERLAVHRRVIVPDVRGRGLSARDPNPERYQPLFYAGDMWALLNHLHVQRCVIIGTSMGGVVAMIMESQQPSRIAGIVLNDVGPELDETGLRRIAANVGVRVELRSWDDAVARAKFLNGAALPDLSEEQWQRFARNCFREDEQGVPRADYDPAVADTFGRVDNKLATRISWHVFHLLRQPMLVLRGAKSDLLSAATVEAMRGAHPKLWAAEIPNRGHAPLLNEPESIGAIDAFLNRLAPAC